MKFVFIAMCLAFSLMPVHCEDINRLLRVLHALTRALDYMQRRVQEINLDAVYSIRQVQEQLQAYLTHDAFEFRTFRHWIEVLRDKAKATADQGRSLIQDVTRYDDGLPYYLTRIGYWMDESPKYVWYPSRNTSDQFVESRVQCAGPYDLYNGTQSDICFSEIKPNNKEHCDISPPCTELTTKRHQREYALSHQMLYWRHMESQRCIDKVPEDLQMRLCSNIMRDAKYIADAGYPESHLDLFKEQIGLCGLWGFRDFNKREWTEKILEWQLDSGCYSRMTFHNFYCTDDLQPDSPIRIKRYEKLLSDNCLAHQTATALLALVSILRFEAEAVFQTMDKSQNTLNKLLV